MLTFHYQRCSVISFCVYLSSPSCLMWCTGYFIFCSTPRKISTLLTHCFVTKWTSSLYKAKVERLPNLVGGESHWNGNWYNLSSLCSDKNLQFRKIPTHPCMKIKNNLSCLILQENVKVVTHRHDNGTVLVVPVTIAVYPHSVYSVENKNVNANARYESAVCARDDLLGSHQASLSSLPDTWFHEWLCNEESGLRQVWERLWPWPN